jgi:antitoxin (DNA-binding transcriptional repressor) of toxin-antitoxin stability system
MRLVSAIEAEGRFSEMLDAIEMHGETFLVLRNGRPVARVGPAPVAHGALVKETLRAHPRDTGWANELRGLRAALGRESSGRRS